MSTQEVFEHHREAFGEQDMEGILDLRDEDSLVVTNFGVYQGLDEIEELFTDLFEVFSDEDLEFAILDEVVEGDVAFFSWEAETSDEVYSFGADTFIVIDDVIRYQTVAVDKTEKN